MKIGQQRFGVAYWDGRFPEGETRIQNSIKDLWLGIQQSGLEKMEWANAWHIP